MLSLYTGTCWRGNACTRAGGESGAGGRVACARGGGGEGGVLDRRSGVTIAEDARLFFAPLAPTARAIAARVAELELLREPGERWMR